VRISLLVDQSGPEALIAHALRKNEKMIRHDDVANRQYELARVVARPTPRHRR
jgi:hypothetical protein